MLPEDGSQGHVGVRNCSMRSSRTEDFNQGHRPRDSFPWKGAQTPYSARSRFHLNLSENVDILSAGC